ncbi:MAG: hypothetical protein M0Z85_12810 [Gammaproteobacteria bacterium]|nr:hypothetical protein [Gammaproteobacteria bacterium]
MEYNYEQSIFKRVRTHDAVPILPEQEARGARDTMMQEQNYDRRRAAYDRQKWWLRVPLTIGVVSLLLALFTPYPKSIAVGVVLLYLVVQALANIAVRYSTGYRPELWGLAVFCSAPLDELRPLFDKWIVTNDQYRHAYVKIARLGIFAQILLMLPILGLASGNGAIEVAAATVSAVIFWILVPFVLPILGGRLWVWRKKVASPFATESVINRRVQSLWNKDPFNPTAPRNSYVGRGVLGVRAAIAKRKAASTGGTTIHT